MYGVPAGNEEARRTEWNIEVTLPVVKEMTMVAAESLSPITARDETSTVISEAFVVESSWRPSSMECKESVPVAKGAMLFE